MVDEIKEIEGVAALYVGNLKNMFDAQKAVYDKTKADLEAEQAALNTRRTQANEKTAYLEGEEAKIAQARSELESKYPVLEKREKDLADKEVQYANDKVMAGKLVEEAGRKTKEADEREARYKDLEEKEKQNNETRTYLADKELKLKEREETINATDETLKKRAADLAAKEADYGKRKGELDNAYNDMEKKINELTTGMAPKEQEPAPEPHITIGGDVEKPTAERLTRKVKKMSIGKKTDAAPEIELAQTVTTDGQSTVAAVPTYSASAPQAAAEDVFYKHEFQIGQQEDVVKVLSGFVGVESSKLTGKDTKYALTGRKADEKRNECDYSFNKGEIRIQFTTKNPAVDAMLAGVKLGQKFVPIRVRPKDRDNKIKEFPDFADLAPKKTGTDEKGEYFIYDLNEEQKKRYKIKALPPKKAKADGQ